MSNFQSFQAPVDGEPKDNLQAHADAQDKKSDQTPPVDRPAWLPEKFKTPEDLVKSYQELEKRFTRENQQAKDTNKTDDTPPNVKASSQNEVKIDFIKVLEEVECNDGKLSDETYKMFEKAGLPREIVDYTIKGAIQEGKEEEKAILDRAGGEEQYEVMAEWAATALTPDEIDAFNQIVNEGSLQEALFAVDALKARYEAANGKPPKLVTGTNTPSSSVGYQSRAEMIRDMSNPLYSTDPAFRKQVAEKIRNSRIM